MPPENKKSAQIRVDTTRSYIRANLRYKDNDEGFFRVRVNTGSGFSPSEIRLYRPEWGTGMDLNADLESDLRQIANNLSFPGSAAGAIRVNGIDPEENELSEYVDPFRMKDVLDYQMGMNVNLGFNLSTSYRFTLLSLTINPGMNGSYATTSGRVMMRDVTGDGLPDHIMKYPGDAFLRVKPNLAGKAGLLKSVQLPQGGACDLEYTASGHTVSQPNHRWLLSSVSWNDGREGDETACGEHAYRTEYSYDHGKYDRWDRQFLGYGRVTKTRGDVGDLQKTVTLYDTTDYAHRGLMLEQEVLDESGFVYRRTERSYDSVPVYYATKHVGRGTVYEKNLQVGSVFPQLTEERTTQWEKTSGPYEGSTITKNYTYDEYGLVRSMRETTESGSDEDTLRLSIDYDRSTVLTQDRYCVGLPTGLVVKSGGESGNTLRHREGSYDDTGHLVSLTTWEDEDTSFTTALTWTDNGLVRSIVDPLGTTVLYTYDDTLDQFVEQIETSGADIAGYTTEMAWDYTLGVMTERTDANGLTERSEYDRYGRLTAVYTPYDESIPAVHYAYEHAGDAYRRSITENKISTDPENEETLRTIIAIDGLGRTIYSAKSGVMTDENGTGETGWNVSGAVRYDKKGRSIEEGQPGFSIGPDDPDPSIMQNGTVTDYDILDRPVRVELPDGSVMTTEYSIEEGLPRTISTDPEGRVTETLSDQRGRVVELRKKYQSTLLMKSAYSYDVLGQLCEAVIRDENVSGSPEYRTEYEYDLRGLQTTLESADTGRTTLSYDEAGRLVKKVSAVLRETGGAVNYEYDGLGRLIHIRYPDPAMDVSYRYGTAAAAAEYGAGRLVSRSDESGSIDYEYGKMGEVIAENRTLRRLDPLSTTREARIEYQSNYLGQMESVRYPDGEEIRYDYDEGGQVIHVEGVRPNGSTTVFVERIGYDEFGQRTYLEYGNGDVTRYTYDPERRWLSTLSTENQWGRNLQNLSYSFDDVGNIEERTDASGRYSSTQSYSYDGLYQLVSAEGTYVNKPSGHTSWTDRYSQSFSYDGLGNILKKTSTETRVPSASVRPLNYELNYEYDENRPHRATKIGELYYSYDANGNVTRESTLPEGQSSAHEAPNLSTIGDVRRADQAFGFINEVESGSENEYIRSFSWDAENRLKSVLTSNGKSVKYLYDADGKRTTKYAGDGSYTEGISGETLYFNEWWTETADSGSFRRAKHIYVGKERIVTRLSNPSTGGTPYEDVNTYYYHPDHLGSAHCITDPQGNPYERIEYTPYGEMWIEIQEDEATASYNYIPFRFTAKEWDEETGLYYYGARYMDPKTSRWMSGDPAGYQLMNPMGQDEKPRQGYSIVEATNWYSYVSNNPVKYVDPTGAYAIWGFIDRIDGSISYSIGTHYGSKNPGLNYLLDGLSNLLPFHQQRQRIAFAVDNLDSNYNERLARWKAYDTRIGRTNGASLAMDILTFVPAAAASKAFSTALTLAGLAMNSSPALSSVTSDRKTDRNMHIFLSSFRTGVLRNCGSDKEAIARTSAFAIGANAFFEHNLEEKGISFNSWGRSLRNILNGRGDEQFQSVMQGIIDGEY
ncbi:RHS repeat-associated core domain-containing protein [Marispirochaeta sp.]|uniref:RHS repeat domain-containing protein n=1 Tax=Marispirochaeta sp. TaxID=2038653 RepID=UPI0029C7BF03|nr:RHS repeat-associated core domain-containing protein [Marispirochaeta sp.]